MIQRLLRRLIEPMLPVPVTCNRCGVLIGYDQPARGKEPAKRFRVEHERICLAADPDTPMLEPTTEEEARRELTPEEHAEFWRLVDVKREALVEAITLYLSRTHHSEEEINALFEYVKPRLLHPIMGMGPGALHNASMEIFTHLVCQLAIARGESPHVTWQREAAELAREDGQRG